MELAKILILHLPAHREVSMTQVLPHLVFPNKAKEYLKQERVLVNYVLSLSRRYSGSRTTLDGLEIKILGHAFLLNYISQNPLHDYFSE